MIFYYTILIISLIFSQDYNNLGTKNISPLLFNSSKSLNERIANNKNLTILSDSIDIKQYIVGPGDEFYISFSANNFSFNNYLVVTPTGNIIIPNVGLIKIGKMNLESAYLLIKKHCNQKYANSNVNISLSDIRKFYIKVEGLSYGDSKILVNPLNTVTDAFEIFITKLSNDNKINISKRKITLNNKINIDYSLNKLKSSNNPYLKEGDTLTLFEHELYVDIYGGVKSPGRYEFYKDDIVNNIIQLAGGLSENSKNTAIINRIDNNEEINIDLNSKYKIYPYDHIIIEVKDPVSRKLINISGEINIPGNYPIKESMIFLDLLRLSGNYTENADTNRIVINNNILQSQEDNEVKRIRLITPSKRSMSEISYLKSRSFISKGLLESNDYNTTKKILNYKINIGDEIIIPPRIDYIEIIGAVENPGRYPFKKGFSIGDYIMESGGKTSKAARKTYIINVYNEKEHVRSDFTNITNGEIIFIESKEDFNLWNKFQESMALVGQLATLVAVLQSASN